MNTTSVPMARSRTAGETSRWKAAKSAPATAASVVARVKAISLVPNTL